MPIGSTTVPPPATGPGWAPRGAPTNPFAGPSGGLPVPPGMATQLLELRRDHWPFIAEAGIIGQTEPVPTGEIWRIVSPHLNIVASAWMSTESMVPFLGVRTTGPTPEFCAFAGKAAGTTPLWVSGGAGAIALGQWVLPGETVTIVETSGAATPAPSDARWGLLYERLALVTA